MVIMDIMDNSILFLVISNLCTGSLSWLFTLKYTKSEAEAAAMSKFQEVYHNLIEDLGKNLQMVKNDRDELKRDRDELKQKLSDFEQRVKNLEESVKKNAQILSRVPSYLCRIAPSCKNRSNIDISEV